MNTSEDQEHLPPPEDHLATAFDLLHLSREKLFEATAQFIHRPVQANSDLVTERKNQTASCSYTFFKCVLDDKSMSNEGKGNAIASFCIEDDVSRVMYFNALVGPRHEEVFKVGKRYSKESYAKIVVEELDIIGQNEKGEEADQHKYDLLDFLIKRYATVLGYDINQLLVIGSNTPKAKFIKISKSIGRHSVDILKVSVGATIAGLALKAIMRNQEK